MSSQFPQTPGREPRPGLSGPARAFLIVLAVLIIGAGVCLVIASLNL